MVTRSRGQHREVEAGWDRFPRGNRVRTLAELLPELALQYGISVVSVQTSADAGRPASAAGIPVLHGEVPTGNGVWSETACECP